MDVLQAKTEAQPVSARPTGLGARLKERAMEPVNAASLGFLRIGFGAIFAWEAWRYFDNNFARGYYLDPNYLFTWWLFDWVRPHEIGTYVHIAVMGLAGAAVALGLFYRFSATIAFLSVTYLFLLDKGRYLNHVYLVCLFTFLLILIPAHAKYSIDGWRKPWLRSETVPAWTVWLMRFQVGIPYFFAGVGKLNFDWLVRGEPLREWLLGQTDFPIIGQFFPYEITTRLMAYMATLLDISVAFLMLNRKTRAPAFGFALGFHFLNSRLFGIGVFPWMMMVVTTIFFDPDWPKRLYATLRSGELLARSAVVVGGLVGFIVGAALPPTFSPVRALCGMVGVSVLAFHLLPERLRQPAELTQAARMPSPWQRFSFTRPLAWFMIAWAAIQLLIPVRHFFIPGNVHWTDEGHRFSWHMLLRAKETVMTFHVRDPSTGEEWVEDLEQHIVSKQIGSMEGRPDMMVQFAHYLEDYYRGLGRGDIEVRVETQSWLNVRLPQELIDPKQDLTKVRRPLVWHAKWIHPLDPYE